MPGMLPAMAPPASGVRATRTPVRLRVLLLRVLLVAAAAAGIVLEHGFYRQPLSDARIHAIQAFLLGAYWADFILRWWRNRVPLPEQRVDWLDAAVLGATAAGAAITFSGWHEAGWRLVEVAIIGLVAAELWRLNVALWRVLASPAIMLPGSFLLLIAIATILLKVPRSDTPDRPISWLDSLFTATSAVCVTGLTVRNTAEQFTAFGQGVICVFIQLGGLGIIFFGSTLAILFGQRLSIRGSRSLSEMLQDQPMDRVRSFTRFILLATIGLELLGAALLMPLWRGADGGPMEFETRVGWSLFHSVSAFCNAGFDLTGQSLTPYRYDLGPHLVMAPLILLGGIGFPALYNLAIVVRHRIRAVLRPPALPHAVDLSRRRLNLHTKVVLLTTLLLYLGGVITVAAGQIAGALLTGSGVDSASVGGALADAHFMSVSARTAGFNTLPMDQLQPAGVFALMALMLVGGSPGSTAGGAKTTTLALLVLSVWGVMRRRKETEAFGRTISDALVRRAGTIAVCYALLITFMTILLSLSERAPLEAVLFEVVSAATTTGLSLGLTPDLTPFGKVVIILTMFLGRVGPLTLLGALILRPDRQRPYAYAHENVALG